MMIELDIDKETAFTLEMQIDGDVSASKPPEMRFSIIGENFVFSVPARRVDNGVYEVVCPKLKGIMASGDYKVNVEVFIDEKHFIPLTDKIRLKEEIKPTVKLAERHEVKATEVKVTIGSKIEEVAKPTLSKTTEVVVK